MGEAPGQFGGLASEWLTLAQAATAAGVGRTTLHRAAERDELAFAVIGRIRFFHLDDIEAWAADRRARGEAA
jgi:excisionase family DNA binding protein